MSRLISVVLLCLLWCGASVAASTDKPDQALLNDIMTALSQHASVRADFTQTRANPALATPQQSSGKLLFVLGHGMLWQTTEPFTESLALTGSHTSRLGPRGFERVREARGMSQVSQMLQSLLAGQARRRAARLQRRARRARWRSGRCVSRRSRRASPRCWVASR